MKLSPSVEKEFCKIHRQRNRVGYFPALVTILLVIYFQRGDSFGVLSILAVSSCLAGFVLRTLIGEVFSEHWENKNNWARGLNLLGFFLIGLAWAIHLWDIFHRYGGFSSQASYVLLFMATFITGSSTVLVADKGSYFVYVMTLALGVGVPYLATFIQGSLDGFFILLNLGIFMAFSVFNYRVGFSQLRELLESRLKTENEKLRLGKIINTVPGYVGLIDKDLRCYMANQTTLTFFPDIIGKKIGEIGPAHSNWEKLVTDFMLSGRRSEISEQSTNIDGKDIYSLVNIQKMEDGGAIIVSVIITELVEARQKLREQEAKSQYTAKLASLGEMAAGIAHEINNPLTIIQGSANIIQRLVDQDPLDRIALKNFSGKLFETTERISKTIRSLKALSRNGERDPMVNVPLGQVLQISSDLCFERFKTRGVDLRVPQLAEEIYVRGREVQLSQVLVNLLNNSLDAVKDLEEAWVKVEIVSEENWIDIFVVDSGKGIQPELRQKIMDPFFTTKDVNQGTGLGLSISKTIVQDHEGELTLLPERMNTTFRVRLPYKAVV